MQQLSFSASYQNEQACITLVFNREFDDQDFPDMLNLLIRQLSGAEVVELIEGADQQAIRIRYQSEVFVLHFECYSQSCWLAAEIPNNEDLLTNIFNLIA